MGIKCDYSDYNSSKIIPSLNQNMPVIVGAMEGRSGFSILGLIDLYSYESGHAWVIDGYEHQQTTYIYYYHWVGSGKPIDSGKMPVNDDQPKDLNGQSEYMTDVSTINTYRLIMNWGWDGSSDEGRYTLDGDWQTGSDNFLYKREMIINFEKK